MYLIFAVQRWRIIADLLIFANLTEIHAAVIMSAYDCKNHKNNVGEQSVAAFVLYCLSAAAVCPIR